MVLPTSYVKINLNDIKENAGNYMVFNAKHLNFSEDKKRVGCAMEAVMLCNSINWANNLIKEMGSKKRLNVDIIFEASKAVLMGRAFTDDELYQFYKTMREIEAFGNAIEKFNTDDLFLSYELEFTLLGVSLENQKENTDKEREIHEKYGDAKFSGLDLNSFIKEAKRISKEFPN
jgi:hypothetical protein